VLSLKKAELKSGGGAAGEKFVRVVGFGALRDIGGFELGLSVMGESGRGVSEEKGCLPRGDVAVTGGERGIELGGYWLMGWLLGYKVVRGLTGLERRGFGYLSSSALGGDFGGEGGGEGVDEGERNVWCGDELDVAGNADNVGNAANVGSTGEIPETGSDGLRWPPTLPGRGRAIIDEFSVAWVDFDVLAASVGLDASAASSDRECLDDLDGFKGPGISAAGVGKNCCCSEIGIGHIMNLITHVSVHDSPFPETFRFVVVVDAKFLEKNFVFVFGHSAGKSLLCLTSSHAALLDERPEGGVV
jgi:hypothetical protein